VWKVFNEDSVLELTPDLVGATETQNAGIIGEKADLNLVHTGGDLLHLIVEIKGYRREDAKEKKSTMETYWVPGVNLPAQYGRSGLR
jgi:hypothetical protein